MIKGTGLILKELDVHHPAARLIVNAFKIQELEIEDSNNYLSLFLEKFFFKQKDESKGSSSKGYFEWICSCFEKSIGQGLLQVNRHIKKVEKLKDKIEISLNSY